MRSSPLPAHAPLSPHELAEEACAGVTVDQKGGWGWVGAPKDKSTRRVRDRWRARSSARQQARALSCTAAGARRAQLCVRTRLRCTCRFGQNWRLCSIRVCITPRHLTPPPARRCAQRPCRATRCLAAGEGGGSGCGWGAAGRRACEGGRGGALELVACAATPTAGGPASLGRSPRAPLYIKFSQSALTWPRAART